MYKRSIKSYYRIYAMDCVYCLLQELSSKELSAYKDMRIRNDQDAYGILLVLNGPSVQYKALQEHQSKHEPWQTFEYIKSNLGNGYIFYFVCNRCDKRASYLYSPNGISNYLCRRCHSLKY